jgi:phage host-nuclease inhibitor protein Gam
MAKAKPKTETIVLYDYAKSDLAPAIARIALLQSKIALAQSKADEAILEIQTKLAEIVDPIVKELKKECLSIKEFSDKNRDDLFPNEFKTLKLETGDISYRSGGTSVDAQSTAKLINEILEKNELLTAKEKFEMKMKNIYLRMKLELDKDAIKATPENALEITGVGLKTGKEVFYVKPYSTNTEIEC